MLAYLQGLSLGLAYVAPIGVQNLFVINAGLSQPRAAAYRTALIVIFFDVTLALAGFFGIGALIEHSELIRKGVLLAGSLVVMYMGLRLMLSREVAGPSINVNIPLMKTIGMACVVTWFNPQAIIDVSLLLGSALMIVIDTLARSLSASEIPISILTAIIGAPFFIVLLRRTGGAR